MKELSLHILDLAQNSIVAGAKLIEIEVAESKKNDSLTILIRDDGKGMAADFAKTVTSPFSTTRTTRKVGLGIPLFEERAEMTGGRLSIRSEPGKGTELFAEFGLSHVDRVPMGDLAGTAFLLMNSNPQLDFRLLVRVDEDEFMFDTRQIREALGAEIPLNSPEVAAWMMESLKEGIESLHGGM
ncbi:MAG: ATP-binding protein [Christensenellaceae bacterium]|jgi:anti-sigma regulatory factor (Ser/Thr protein kinase)|nr:ATP-binding protein [Christensenellaceae bacterium]